MNPSTPWWQEAIIYHIYPRSYQDTTGDGVGDLEGIIARLDHLKGAEYSLDVDAIWLSPFFTSPMADFGYDVADYTDVDPLFGDLETFDRLLEAAHRRGLRVIVDYVPNHTSEQHQWFQESRVSRDSPKRDWYIWRDAAPDGGPPNNWLSVFGGSAWEWDEATGQYYLHSFLKQQPDVNWRNPELVAAMHDVLRFWLDRGVDGLRIDAIHYVMKDPQFRNNPVSEQPVVGVKPLGPFDEFEHLYDFNQPEVHDAIRGMRAVVDSYEDRVVIGETYFKDLNILVSYYGASSDGLDLPVNFRLMHEPWDAQAYRASVDAYEAALPQGAWPNYVLGSHDDHRLATRVGSEARARVAAMLLLTLRGTPVVYYGEEIGMVDGHIPPEYEQDPFGLQVPGFRLDRDPERTPMQWDDSATAGFSEGRPWLPIAEGYETRNVAAQRDDPKSMLSLCRELIQTRKGSPALLAGSYTPVDDVPDDCFVYLRESGGQRMLVALNFSDQRQRLSLRHIAEDATLRMTTKMDSPDVKIDELGLRPHEGLLLELD